MVAVLALSACSNGERNSAGPFGGDNPLAPASEEEIAEATAAYQPGAAADHIGRSAVDSLTDQRRAELDPTSTLLAGMLPSPDGFGAFRLAFLQVDDPNGDGRIGEFWYPPRILQQECSAKVDAAPGPVAVANYVPGSGALGESDQMATFDVMSAAVTVGVQIQLFDDADQRDAYLATTVEFLRDPTFTCGGKEASVQTYRESAVSTTSGSALVFEAEPDLFGGGVRAYITVGDRVMLVVSVGSDAVEAPWEVDDINRWLSPALEVTLARLGVAELP